MKTLRIWAMLAALLAFGALLAQQTPDSDSGIVAPTPPLAASATAPARSATQRRIVGATTRATTGRSVSATSATTTVRATPPPIPPPLKENVTLEIKGTVLADVPIDVTWTGSGPDFQLNSDDWVPKPFNPNGILLLSDAIIGEVEGGFNVHLTIGARIGIPKTQGVTNTNYSLNTVINVLLKPGQPVVVYQGNGGSLTATLTKAPAPATAVAPVSANVDEATATDFDENLKLTAKGSVFGGWPLNLTMLTSAAYYSMSSIEDVKDASGSTIPPLINYSGRLAREADGRYRLTYMMGERRASVAPGSSGTVMATPSSVQASVLLELDQPVTVLKNAGQTVTLTISKADAK